MDEIKVCPVCKEEWNEEDVYCRYCGARKGNPECIVPIIPLIYGPMPKIRKHNCSQCGYSWNTELMVDKEKFCPRCGGEAPAENEDQSEEHTGCCCFKRFSLFINAVMKRWKKVLCPHCGAKNAMGAEKCQCCGRAIADNPEPPAVPIPKIYTVPIDSIFKELESLPVTSCGPVIKEGKVICSHCGARQSADAVTCKYCGTPMQMIGMEIEGKYRITKLLGSGGQFEMYLALNIHTGQTVEIKSYDKKRKGFNSQFYSLVMQGADMMRAINHPCAPRVYDLIENEQCLFMVREYIEGKTLSAISDEYGALSEDRVLSWTKEICEGLKYLHTMNPPRIHRDIKPQNILLTTDGKIKIIDFGLMKCFNPSEKEDAIVLGTVGYAPPEQYSGRTDVRTDIYALGITMHQLVTGVAPNRPPYEAKPIRQINPALSQKLEKIIAKCIEKDPAKRYQSCEDLLMALSDENP